MGKREASKLGGGDKYKRRKKEGKITVRTFEKVVRNQTINYLPEIHKKHISQCIRYIV